jgi:Protein of unknown function (DUF3431)
MPPPISFMTTMRRNQRFLALAVLGFVVVFSLFYSASPAPKHPIPVPPAKPHQAPQSLFPPGSQGGPPLPPAKGNGKAGTVEADQKEEKVQTLTKELVVASIKNDDVTWLKEFLPDWKHNVYVANDQSAPLTVETNKGREANVYLTYGTLNKISSKAKK